MLDDHVLDHGRLFDRVEFDLDTGEYSDLPTNERLAKFQEHDDPQLAALFFQYARYLLIASSRPGTQPANLQGIWSRDLRPPWSATWTTNINVQMNYWLAETGNLADCHLPLFDLVERLSVTGANTARIYYGLQGWTAHHNVDIWGEAAPVGEHKGDPTWANWPMGGAWLCQHIWEHYQFSGDKVWPRDRGYPLMKGAAQFMLGWNNTPAV